MQSLVSGRSESLPGHLLGLGIRKKTLVQILVIFKGTLPHMLWIADSFEQDTQGQLQTADCESYPI